MAVMGDRSIVHSQKCEAAGVTKKHRNRISFEQQSEGFFPCFQAADVGQCHRNEIANGGDADTQIHLRPGAVRAIELEPRAAAAVKSGDEAGQSSACRKNSAYFGKTAPPEVFGGASHEARCAIIESSNLEINRRTLCVADDC